jgi:hypothetical protein
MLCILLALCLVFTLTPTMAHAANWPDAPTQGELAANDYVLYFVNAGTSKTTTVPEGDRLGVLQGSQVEKASGVDATTGYTWGYRATPATVVTAISENTGGKENSVRYVSSGGSTSATIIYDFQLPPGVTQVEVTAGFKMPYSSWGSRPLSLRLNGVSPGASANQFTVGQTLVERTFITNVTTGTLTVGVLNTARTGTGNDPLVSYIIVRSMERYSLTALAAKVAEIRADIATPGKYATAPLDENLYLLSSLSASLRATLEGTAISDVNAILDNADTMVGAGTATADDVRTLLSTLEAAWSKLRLTPHYDSWSGIQGKQWLDTNGVPIEGHGGQVVKFGNKWWWYGEDRTSGYNNQNGVAAYSSTDLYNWTFEGFALRTINTRAELDNVPYFQTLYSDYTTAQKDALWNNGLHRAASTSAGASVFERPKVLYNAKNNNYVMWVHNDGPTPSAPSSAYASSSIAVATSDNPQGPFKFIKRVRGNQMAANAPEYQGGEWWKDAANRGHARDMNVIQEDDGTAYVMYSTEENMTQMISKLNEDYTDFTAPTTDIYGTPLPTAATLGTGTLGVDFIRCFPGAQREAPAPFQYNGKWYIVTSGTDGWNYTQSRLWKVDTDNGIQGIFNDISKLKNLGDPCISSGDDIYSASKTWNTQVTNVIPVDPVNGKFIFMADRWEAATDLLHAPHIWLPVVLTPTGGVEIYGNQTWNQEIFDKINLVRIAEDYKLKDNYFLDEDLPTSIPAEARDVTAAYGVSGWQESALSVNWAKSITSLPLAAKSTFTGTFDINGTPTDLKVQATNIPNGLLYFADCGATVGSDLWDEITDVDHPAYAPHLKNTNTWDQRSTATTNWGYTNTVSSSGANIYYKNSESTDPMTSGWYHSNSSTVLNYRFPIDQTGTYYVTAGFQEWWSTSRTMRLEVSYPNNAGTGTASVTKDFTNTTESVQALEFTVPTIPTAAANRYVTVTLRRVSGGDPVISWIALAADTASKSAVNALAKKVATARATYPEAISGDLIGWAAYATAIANAETILSDYMDSTKDLISTAQVDTASAALTDAMSKLKWKASSAMITALQIIVDQMESTFPEADYTPSSWAPFGKALDDANAILATPGDFTDADVDAVFDALLDGANKLVRIADKSGLKMAIDYAADLLKPVNVGKYIPVSVEKLEEALSVAAIVYADVDAIQTKVDKANEDLLNAIGQVYEKGDKAGLQALVTLVSRYAETNYTPATWAAFTKALDDARTVIANPNAIADSVNKAYTALSAAVTGLTRKADFAALNASIVLAQRIVNNIGDYVPSTVVGLAEELNGAKAVSGNPNASQAEVNAAAAALSAKILAARLKPDLSGLLSETTGVRAVEESLYSATSDTIIPKGKISKITVSTKGKILVKWAKAPASAKVTAYQLQYRVKGSAKWTLKTVSAKSASLTIRNLKKNKTYQVRVRACRSDSGTKQYGAWSAVKISRR